MIPAAFDYRRADTVPAALELLAEFGDEAKLLAGGQSLLPLMKFRLAQPTVLVDVRRISALDYVRDDGDTVAVGAMTRHCDLQRSELLRREVPLLAHVAGLVGDPQVRHRGTIGGSVAHADPAGDLPAALLALDAEFVLTARQTTRTVPAAEFFTGFFETVLGDDEMLTEIRIGKPGSGFGYQKFTRRAIDWATVGVAAQRGADGTMRVALVNMGATPLRATATEAALVSGAAIADAAALAAQGTEPPSDLAASAGFRRHLASVLTGRALESATAG